MFRRPDTYRVKNRFSTSTFDDLPGSFPQTRYVRPYRDTQPTVAAKRKCGNNSKVFSRKQRMISSVSASFLYSLHCVCIFIWRTMKTNVIGLNRAPVKQRITTLPTPDPGRRTREVAVSGLPVRAKRSRCPQPRIRWTNSGCSVGCGFRL